MQYDDIYTVRWKDLRGFTVDWIDRLERRKLKKPAYVVTATAVVFLMMCKNFDLDPRRVLEACERMWRRALLVEPMYPRGMAEAIKAEFRE